MRLKYTKISLALLFLSVLFSSLSHATESPYPAFKKGAFAHIQQAHKDAPYIIAFWSETCAYCMKELAMLGKLLPHYPTIKLVTITTDPFLDNATVNRILSKKKLTHTETWVFADNFVERLYADIDPNWQGELPLTYFIGKDEKLVKHMGIVKEKELIDWLNQQQ